MAPYEQLLKVFWEMHDPTQSMRQGNDVVGTQYRSGIYVFSEAQREEALASRDRYQAALTGRGFGEITTEIVDAGPFYYAEEYHQQYLSRNPYGYCNPRLLPGRLPARRSRGRLTAHRPSVDGRS